MTTKENIGRAEFPPGYTPAKEVVVDDALKLAVAMHRANGLDDAETVYGRILSVAPDHADALHFMGVLQHQRGRSEDALRLIRRSIVMNAAVPDWHNNLGNVLLETGQLDPAANAYEEAVRLAPDRADIVNNLGVLRREQGRVDESEAAYRRAIELDPKHSDFHVNLGRLLHAQGRNEDALRAYCEALVLGPRYGRARQALGWAYFALGRFDDASEVYRDWLRDEPDSPEARHLLAACSGEAVPGRAADAYVETVFDGFANSFDAKLAMLHYCAPDLVAQTVADVLGQPRRALDVLDAGCGTGLCGPLLAPYARRLQGVDLSAGMLAKAEPRKVYDGLAKAELTAFIEREPAQSYDLVVSADTLCYFGDLQSVAHAVGKALRPGGWLVFTVEALTASGEAGFHLNPHGRYSHRDAYLRQVLGEAGLAVDRLESAHLRMEGGKPVEGWVVAARADHSPLPGQAQAE